MSRIAGTLVVVSLLWLVSSPAQARECEGVRLPNSVQVEGTALRLNGMGIREATVFNVNVYVAGLYLESPTRNASQIVDSDQTKRLVLRFVRDVSGEDIRGAFSEGFRSNAGGQLGSLQSRINQLNRLMPREVTEGSMLSFTYIPGTGLQVRVGRRVRGVIEGDDFAHTFFKIWLGSSPPNSGLKTGLLGGSCG